MSTLLDSCIEQHGESARTYIDIALKLGGMCLLPNVGFDSSLQGIIDDLLQSQDPERSGVRDVRVFAKSSSYAEFSKDTIELQALLN